MELCRCSECWERGGASHGIAGIRRPPPVSAATKDLEKISGSGARVKDSPDFGALKIERRTTEVRKEILRNPGFLAALW